MIWGRARLSWPKRTPIIALRLSERSVLDNRGHALPNTRLKLAAPPIVELRLCTVQCGAAA